MLLVEHDEAFHMWKVATYKEWKKEHESAADYLQMPKMNADAITSQMQKAGSKEDYDSVLELQSQLVPLRQQLEVLTARQQAAARPVRQVVEGTTATSSSQRGMSASAQHEPNPNGATAMAQAQSTGRSSTRAFCGST